MIKLTLPRPPSTNNLFGTRGAQRRCKTTRYAAWSRSAAWEIRAQRPGRLEGAVWIEIALERPDAHRRDCSNFIKGIEDALVDAGVIEDDSLVERVTVCWLPTRGDRAHITVGPAESTQLTPARRTKGKPKCTRSDVSLAA